uniref:[histone H3]-trimethyl-L-lysine(4) demethylase n=1 Tax=Ditylenchus dipsaci TaxID=166011 RepID=A0A915E9Z1_9BILA
MEKSLERFYKKFERPPFAPTYYPSEEEFSDPIAYVAKIKSEAEDYGVVKIVPPASFRPPFVIDSSKFEFTPRVQRLNEIDALFRVRIVFINKLVNFWHLQGQQFRLPWVENKYIDLYRLRKLVEESGGLKKVNYERKWSQIARSLGFKPASGPTLKQHYIKWILPYEHSIEKSELEDVDAHTTQTHPAEPREDKCARTMQGRRRMATAGTSTISPSQSRMMAGMKRKPMPSLDKSSLSIDLVACHKCGGGGDEARLLLCENCDRSLHTYCLVPPLAAVPKGDWRCPKCVANEVKKVSFEFGFHDSNQLFTLEEFGEWANDFKQSYFKQAPCDVDSEKVETEFWQNVINFDKDVSVKYGADLITSKVGSGFPRKTDIFKGVDAKDRIAYASHPWNLNNLPVLRESVLSHIDTGISGMMVPWVYVGMCFSTFCWHVEDHWTYSINYNHWGERKIWYGITGKDAEKFDQIVKSSVPELFVDQPDLLHHMTTALNPRFLMDKGLSIYTVQQNAGEFVITFPRAYHAGFNEGLNFAEAVNFAPPDWLQMGRMCLTNYANIQRTCVFSHGELVMKMVQVADKMSIGMCLATLEELRYIVKREAEFRKQLTHNGLRESEFCKFEDVPDDARSCIVCKTTMYVSALVCKHKSRIVCMNHMDQLCSECQISDCCLRFRYTLEDLIPLANKLAQRTTSFEEWRDRVAQLYKEEANEKLEIRHILEGISRFDKLCVAANKIINRKIRLRDNTRCQKADNRCDFTELERLRQQLQESDIQDEALEKSLDNLHEKINSWKVKLMDTIENYRYVYGGSTAVDLFQEIAYEGEEFNLKLPEMELLKMESARCQWLLKANKMLDWVQRRATRTSKQLDKDMQQATIKQENGSPSTFDNALDIKEEEVEQEDEEEEDIDDDGQLARFDVVRLNKMISDGSRWIHSCDLVKGVATSLYQMQRDGVASETKAEELLENAEGIGFFAAEQCWKQLMLTDWLDSEHINEFRDELQLAKEIHINYPKLIEDPKCSFSLKVLEQLEQQCEKSLLERNGPLHQKVSDLKLRLKHFVDKIQNMFQKAIGYYNVFEIIAGRDDLPSLVEGDPLPLPLFRSTKYNDNWAQLKQFNSNSLLSAHLAAISEQQSNLLMALRLVNQKRPLKETCSCGKEAGGSQPSQLTISCFLCNSGFHSSCAQWEPFLDRMPPGVFLCPRCLRSRRPCIEDVEAACESAPAFSKLQKNVYTIPQGTDLTTISEDHKLRIQESMVMALSLEIMDVEAYQMAFSSAYFQLFPIGEVQVEVWRQIQAKMVAASPRSIIFPHTTLITGQLTGGAGGRRNSAKRQSNSGSAKYADQKHETSATSSTNGTPTGSKKRCKEVYHADKEICAADKCLRPYRKLRVSFDFSTKSLN